MRAEAMPTEIQDSEVLDGFRTEDGAAVGQVQGWVEGVVHLGRWNFEDAEGVVQEILIKLLRIVRADRFGGQSSFKTFVFSVARHTCIDVYRRQRLRTSVHAPEAAAEGVSRANPERELLERQQRELLSYVFQKLTDECRQLWKWIYREGLPAAVVGERLGITAGNVRVRAHRCLEKARKIGRDFQGTAALDAE